MSGLSDLRYRSVAEYNRKISRIYLRTSLPASPNFNAAYPIAGSAVMVKGGVSNLHFHGAFALIAMMVATIA